MKVSRITLFLLAILIVSIATLTVYFFTRYQLTVPQFSLQVKDRLTNITQELQVSNDNDGDSESVVITKLTPQVTTFELRQTIDIERINQAYSSYLKRVPTFPIKTIEIYRMSYIILLESGEVVPVKASVFVPKSDLVAQSIFVFGSGTTGLADMCAPSLEDVGVTNVGNYENHMITQASQNHITVFPDYEGFNNSERLQSYFVADTEARVLLGAVEALRSEQVKQYVKNIPIETVFLSGYSQGGQAALAAASQREMLTDPKSIKGIIGYATASDLPALMRETPQLTPYILSAYEQEYGDEVPIESILKPEWVNKLSQSNRTICIDRILATYPAVASELYTESFNRSLQSDALAIEFSGFNKLIKKNSTFNDIETIPMLQLQGVTDPIVTAKTQRKNRKQWCESGSLLFYKEYEGINHYQTRQAGFTDTQEWIQARLDGEVPAVNCEKI